MHRAWVAFGGGALLAGCGAEVTVTEAPASVPPTSSPADAPSGFVDAEPYECGTITLAQMGLDVPLCEAEPRVTVLDEGRSWDAAREGTAMRLVVDGDEEVRLPRVAVDGTVEDAVAFTFPGEGYQQARGVGVDTSGRIWTALIFDGATSFGGETLEPLGEPLTLALARSSATGELLGVETIGLTSHANQMAMVPLEDGMTVCGLFETMLTLGPTEPLGGWDAFVAAFTGDGSSSWFHTIGTPLLDAALNMAIGSDGTIYIVGLWGGGSAATSGGLLARMSSAGELLSVTQLDDPRVGRIDDVALLADGTLVVVGATQRPPDSDIDRLFIARLGVDDGVLWFRELGHQEGLYGLGEVEVLADGRIIVATTLQADPCGPDEESPTKPLPPHSQPMLVVVNAEGGASCAYEWGSYAVITALIAFDTSFAVSGYLYGPTFGDEENTKKRHPFVARLE